MALHHQRHSGQAASVVYPVKQEEDDPIFGNNGKHETSDDDNDDNDDGDGDGFVLDRYCIPGPVVVLQGMPGDGLMNTLQYPPDPLLPTLFTTDLPLPSDHNGKSDDNDDNNIIINNNNNNNNNSASNTMWMFPAGTQPAPNESSSMWGSTARTTPPWAAPASSSASSSSSAQHTRVVLGQSVASTAAVVASQSIGTVAPSVAAAAASRQLRMVTTTTCTTATTKSSIPLSVSNPTRNTATMTGHDLLSSQLLVDESDYVVIREGGNTMAEPDHEDSDSAIDNRTTAIPLASVPTTTASKAAQSNDQQQHLQQREEGNKMKERIWLDDCRQRAQQQQQEWLQSEAEALATPPHPTATTTTTNVSNALRHRSTNNRSSSSNHHRSMSRRTTETSQSREPSRRAPTTSPASSSRNIPTMTTMSSSKNTERWNRHGESQTILARRIVEFMKRSWWIYPPDHDHGAAQLGLFDTVPQVHTVMSLPPQPVGRLYPGMTLIATAMHTYDMATMSFIDQNNNNNTDKESQSQSNNNFRYYPCGRPGWIQIVELDTSSLVSDDATDDDTPTSATASMAPDVISSHHRRFAVASIHGYVVLGPGLPAQYVQPQRWLWRVTASVGAFVRQGLDLSTRHMKTIPYGQWIYVKRKTINALGLSRLQIRRVGGNDGDGDDDDGDGRSFERNLASTTTTSTPCPDDQNQNQSQSSDHLMEGWCSEYLNPLSGQRGSIVQPLPFPVPALYRVILPEGAMIRANIELSSRPIGQVPVNSLVSVIGRAFSEHPIDQCVERLQLAGYGAWSRNNNNNINNNNNNNNNNIGSNDADGGWISVRLNLPSPHNALIVEYAGIDPGFDPVHPALYHWKKTYEVYQLMFLQQQQHEAVSQQQQQQQNQQGRSTFPSASTTHRPSRLATPAMMMMVQSSPSLATTPRTTTATHGLAENATSAATLEQPTGDDDHRVSPETISSIDDDDNDDIENNKTRNDRQGSNNQFSIYRSGESNVTMQGRRSNSNSNSHSSNTASRRFKSGSIMTDPSNSSSSSVCLICLCDNRTSTLVHGDTGHIACCLTCARIIKARGDPCPVCRCPIDKVIQHFWA